MAARWLGRVLCGAPPAEESKRMKLTKWFRKKVIRRSTPAVAAATTEAQKMGQDSLLMLTPIPPQPLSAAAAVQDQDQDGTPMTHIIEEGTEAQRLGEDSLMLLTSLPPQPSSAAEVQHQDGTRVTQIKDAPAASVQDQDGTPVTHIKEEGTEAPRLGEDSLMLLTPLPPQPSSAAAVQDQDGTRVTQIKEAPPASVQDQDGTPVFQINEAPLHRSYGIDGTTDAPRSKYITFSFSIQKSKLDSAGSTDISASSPYISTAEMVKKYESMTRDVGLSPKKFVTHERGLEKERHFSVQLVSLIGREEVMQRNLEVKERMEREETERSLFKAQPVMKIEEEKAAKQTRREMVPHAKRMPKFDNLLIPQKSTKDLTKARPPMLRMKLIERQ